MKRIGLTLFILLLCVVSCGAYPLNTDDPGIQASVDYIRGCQKSDGGFGEIGRESSPGTTSWVIMAAVAAGEDPRNWANGGNSTLDYLRSMNDEILAKGGTVDIARTILTLVAIGEDPRAFCGTDHVTELKSRVKPDGQAGDHVYTTIWTVIALASVGEDTDSSAEWLIARQNTDGGFPWTPGAESDPDDTGAALEALAAAGVSSDATVVQNALAYLKGMQQEDGGFHYGGTSATNAASDAWVIQGIVAAGENPAEWVVGERGVVEHLLGLQNPDGSFRYTAYVTDSPCRMTASAIPALLGMPYPITSAQVQQPQSSTPEPRATTVPLATTPTVATASVVTDNSQRSVTVTDDFGEIITIRGTPQRIVSLAPSNTEILYALDLDDRVVGVTDYCNYPPEAADKPRVGGYSTVNIEKVIAAEPDLVLAALGNTEDVVNRLRSLGLTVVSLNPLTVEDVLHDIELLGVVTGQEEEASTLVGELRARVEAVTGKTETLEEKPSVTHVVWYDPIWVSGRDTFQDEVIRMAGGVNVFDQVDGWGIVSLEEFIVMDPDYILVSSGDGMSERGRDIVYDYFMNEPRMQELTAVRNGRVYVIDADAASRGGPRIVDALEEAAAIFHPDLFEAGSPKETTAARSPGFTVITLACALLVLLLIHERGRKGCSVRQSRPLTLLFAVLALGSLICPVTGQEISGSEVWRSGVGDPVMAVALSEDGLYSPVITERNIYVYDQNATVLWRYPVSHGKGVAVSSDSERIAAAGDHLLLFDREGNIIWRYKPDSRIRDVALTADGRTICTATDAGLRVFSLNKERTVANVSWTFDAKDRIKSVSVDGGVRVSLPAGRRVMYTSSAGMGASSGLTERVIAESRRSSPTTDRRLPQHPASR